MSHARIGDAVRLGICVGYSMEPAERFGRLVGIRRSPEREIERYIIREYRDGDGAFPTGGWRTTSIIGLCPHYDREGVCDG